MVKIIAKILLPLVFWAMLAAVIFTVPYPNSFAQARLDQLTFFFVPLFLAILFTLNLFLKNFLQSFSLALAVIFFLVLKALGALDIVTGLLTLVATGLLFSYFRKTKSQHAAANSGFKNLTKQAKIPKLTHRR